MCVLLRLDESAKKELRRHIELNTPSWPLLRDDLRLPEAVNPLNFAIELSVNVGDHKGAQQSIFNGS